MKHSKKTLRILKHLHLLQDVVRYYMNDECFKNSPILEDSNQKYTAKQAFCEIQSFIKDLSMEQKVHDIRLWNKFKKMVKSD